MKTIKKGIKTWADWHKKKIRPIQNWSKVRREILERDGYLCRICQRTVDECDLNVHHKEWDRSFNRDQDLVTLCSDCHKAIHLEGYKPSLYQDYPEPWDK